MVPGLGVEPRRARGPRDFKATGERQRIKDLANSLPFPVSEESEEGRRVRGVWTPRWIPEPALDGVWEHWAPPEPSVDTHRSRCRRTNSRGVTTSSPWKPEARKSAWSPVTMMRARPDSAQARNLRSSGSSQADTGTVAGCTMRVSLVTRSEDGVD